MSSASAPSYYFDSINFNSYYYSAASSASSSIFLKKTMADTAQGLITFNAGLKSDLIAGKATGNSVNIYIQPLREQFNSEQRQALYYFQIP